MTANTDAIRLAIRALADDIVRILDVEPSRERRVELLDGALHGAIDELDATMTRKYETALAIVAVLVERAGGMVRFPKALLLRDCILTSTEARLTDEVVLTTRNP